jgi:hypothetical protein
VKGPHIRSRGGELLVDGRYLPLDEVLRLVRIGQAADRRRQPRLPIANGLPAGPLATPADVRRARESLPRTPRR